MSNENTLVDQTMAKTTKLPTQIRFITKSNICIPSCTVPRTGTKYATPSSALLCLANELNHVTLMQILYAQPSTKLRNILERKLYVLFELLRSL
jgi:hypothetical protein